MWRSLRQCGGSYECRQPAHYATGWQNAQQVDETLGGDDGYEADGLRAGSVDIEAQMCPLLSSDEISLNKLTKPSQHSTRGGDSGGRSRIFAPVPYF
jgi:hypothetical protein